MANYIIGFVMLLIVWAAGSLGVVVWLGKSLSETRMFGIATVLSMIQNGFVAFGTLIATSWFGTSIDVLNIFQLSCLIVFVLLAVATGMFALQIRREGASKRNP